MPRKVVRCSLALLVSCAAAAVAGTSTAANPVVTFSSPGTKQVSLQACTSGGCTTAVKWVTVLDPMPEVVGVSVFPTAVLQGELVHLTATGIGAPTLAYDWRVHDVLGVQVATLSGSGADWTTNVPPGPYTVYLDLSNAYGIQTTLPALVVVATSSSLFSDGFEAGSTVAWSGP